MKTQYIILVALVYLCIVTISIGAIFSEYPLVTGVCNYSFLALISFLIFYTIYLFVVTLLVNKKLKISSRFIIVIKVILLPFYISFLLFGVTLFNREHSSIFEVFLMYYYLVSIVFIYLLLVTTSLPNIIKLVNEMATYRKVTFLLILSLIFHLFFGLDVIGAIIVNSKSNGDLLMF